MENKLGTTFKIEDLSTKEIDEIMGQLSQKNSAFYDLSINAETLGEKRAGEVIYNAMTEKYDILKSRYDELKGNE